MPTPFSLGQWAMRLFRWLAGMTWRHPFSIVASFSGNHTVRIFDSSASGRMTPLS